MKIGGKERVAVRTGGAGSRWGFQLRGTCPHWLITRRGSGLIGLWDLSGGFLGFLVPPLQVLHWQCRELILPVTGHESEARIVRGVLTFSSRSRLALGLIDWAGPSH